MSRNKGISETAFLSQVADLLNLFQWRWCHIRPAYSERGWRTPIQGHDPNGFKGKGLPDIIAVRPPRLLFAELKDEHSKPTPEQEAWLEDLQACMRIITSEPLMVRNGKAELNLTKGIKLLNLPEIYLWRPSMIDKIAEVLK